MPWCADCDRFLSPSTVSADGTCPSCGRPVDPGRAHAPTTSLSASPSASLPASPSAPATDAVEEEATSPLPWHLWLLLAALAIYLGYRAFQGLAWVFGI